MAKKDSTDGDKNQSNADARDQDSLTDNVANVSNDADGTSEKMSDDIESTGPPVQPHASGGSEHEDETIDEPRDDIADSDSFEGDDTPAEEPAPAPEQVVVMRRGKMARMKDWMRVHKKTSILIGLLLVIVILMALPRTRYPILGTFYKQQMTFAVTDTETHKPVSNATISVAGKTTQTDGQGHASIKAPVGNKTLTLTKKYYQTLNQKVFVPLKKPATTNLQVKATGRQVPVTVTNKITGKAVENAVVKVLDADAKTDKEGHATLVLPADKATQPATITAGGYNDLSANVTVTTETVSENSFAITPSGTVYFLSNLSGKIDVVKTNLDGTNRKTVLAGTGKEDKQSTVLLASRDWKYLALQANREGAAKLYLIDTSNDALSTIDEGASADFTPKGWSNDTFIYTVTRQTVPVWQAGQQSLKSYNAATHKLNQLDQTAASGASDADSLREAYGDVYIFPKSEIVFTKDMAAGFAHPGGLTGQQVALQSIHDDGSAKKTIKAFPVPASSYTQYARIPTVPDEPGSIYLQDPFVATTFYDYGDGQIKVDASLNLQKFYEAYNTYLLSPNGMQTFWSEARDGKNSLFVGDSEGSNGKQIASLSDYAAFGWYGENYLLATKNGSELYILPASGSGQPLKVSDYYRSGQNIRGYGGGYGGF